MEAFKPDEEPDDAYAMIGINGTTADASSTQQAPPPPATERVARPASPMSRPDSGSLTPNGLW
jgi:penicillin-binding protein 1A